jgi:threonine/homoserine/homoserine lactone efflux protein
MLLDPQVLAFAGVAAILTITPGPDTFLVMRSSLAGGFARGMAATWGILAGGVIHASLAALGLSAILLRSARLFETVKLVGAAYLIWVGIRTVREARRSHPTAGNVDGSGTPAEPSRPAFGTFLDGFLTNVLNPKVAVFYLAFLPQFLRPGDPVVAKTFLLVGIHYALALLWLPMIALCVDRAAGTITQPAFRRRLEYASGVVLTALGLRLALERR